MCCHLSTFMLNFLYEVVYITRDTAICTSENCFGFSTDQHRQLDIVNVTSLLSSFIDNLFWVMNSSDCHFYYFYYAICRTKFLFLPVQIR